MQSPVSSLIDQGPNKDLSLFLFHSPSLFNEVRFVLKIPLSDVLFLRLAFPWHVLQGNLHCDETSLETSDVII